MMPGNKKVKMVMLATLLLILIGGIIIYLLFQSDYFTSENLDSTSKLETPTPIIDHSASLPEDFPSLSGAAIDSSWENDTEEIRGSSFVLRTQKTPEEVFNHYKTSLEQSSWDIKNADEETLSITFEKQEIYGFLVITQDEENNTLISITTAELKNE